VKVKRRKRDGRQKVTPAIHSVSFGLLTTLTMLYFGLAVFFDLLLTRARGHLLTPWP